MKYTINSNSDNSLRKVVAVMKEVLEKSSKTPPGMPRSENVGISKRQLYAGSCSLRSTTAIRSGLLNGLMTSDATFHASEYVKALESVITEMLSQEIPKGLDKDQIYRSCISFVAKAAKWEIMNNWIETSAESFPVQDLQTIQTLGFPKKLVDDFCEKKISEISDGKRDAVTDSLQKVREDSWTSYFTNHPNKVFSDQADQAVSEMIVTTVNLFQKGVDTDLKPSVAAFCIALDALQGSDSLRLKKAPDATNEDAMVTRNKERLTALVEPYMRAALATEKPLRFGNWFAADQDGNRYSDGRVFAETVEHQVEAYKNAYLSILGEFKDATVVDALRGVVLFLDQPIASLMRVDNLNTVFMDLVEETERSVISIPTSNLDQQIGTQVSHCLRVMRNNRLTNGQMLRQDGGIFIKIFEEYGNDLSRSVEGKIEYKIGKGEDNTAFFDELYDKLGAPENKEKFLSKINECIATQRDTVDVLQANHEAIAKEEALAKNMAFTDFCAAKAVLCTLTTVSSMAKLPNAGGLSHMIQSNSGDTAGVDQEYLSALPFIKALKLDQDPAFRFSLLNERGESVIKECPEGFEKLEGSRAYLSFLESPAGIKSLVFGPSDNSRVKGTWAATAYLRQGAERHGGMAAPWEVKMGIGNAQGRLVGELNAASFLGELPLGLVAKSQTCQGVEATEYTHPETASAKLRRLQSAQELAAVVEMTNDESPRNIDVIFECFKHQSDPYRALLSGYLDGNTYKNEEGVRIAIGESVSFETIIKGLSRDLYLRLLEAPDSFSNLTVESVESLREEALKLQAIAKNAYDTLKKPFTEVKKISKEGSIRPANRPAPLENHGHPSVWEGRAIGEARDQWAMALPVNILVGLDDVFKEIQNAECYDDYCNLLDTTPENRNNSDSLRLKTLFDATQEAALHYELMHSKPPSPIGPFEGACHEKIRAAISSIKKVNHAVFGKLELFSEQSESERDLIYQKAEKTSVLRCEIAKEEGPSERMATIAYLMQAGEHCG